jgi:hypothetical protein
MINAVSKGLTQKPAVIKGGPPVTRSRAFALWLALLVLYFLILPSAAETPDSSGKLSALDRSGESAAPASRYEALPRRP